MLQHDYFLMDPLDNSWMLSRTVPIFFGMHDASIETVSQGHVVIYNSF